MHPNQSFRKKTEEENIAFSRRRSFGTLAVNADAGPLMSHVPFQLSEDGKYLEAHLVRSNPILRLLKQPLDAVVAVNGGDLYVSPDWYGIDDQVPTWNYVAVHLRGQLRKLEQEELHGILVRLSAAMEEKLAPKVPWKIDKMDDEVYAKMQKQIVPVAMDVSDIQGTWKLSQNKPDSVRNRAIPEIAAASFGSEVKYIVELMKQAENTG